MHSDFLTAEAIDLVEKWLEAARRGDRARNRAGRGPLADLVADPEGVSFAMRFVDRVCALMTIGPRAANSGRWWNRRRCRRSSPD